MTGQSAPFDLAGTIQADGFAVVEGVLSRALVDRAVAALEDVFAQERDIASARGWSTDAYRVAYLLPAKQALFLDLCTHPGLVGIARSVLGDDCVLSGCNGLAMVEAGHAQTLHRDQPDATPGTTVQLHVVCALDAFTEASGATRFVPGSHLRPGRWVPDASERASLADETRTVLAEPGGVVAFDAAVLHAAGANRTERPRRALHVFFRRPWVQAHWDIPDALSPETMAGLTAEQRSLLGVDQRPARYDSTGRVVRRGYDR